VGGWPGYGGQQAANLLVPLVFVQFSRAFEAEADVLGLQYTYKAGYDPTAVLDFFERLQNLQKRKPGSVAKVLSTHPMAQDRIRASQKNIRERLKARPEYVVNTSEFEAVKTHLMALSTWRKLDNEDLNRPRLRKRPGQQHVTNWTQPADTPARSTL
jgi:predicted Zn-dependent protease